LHDLVIYIFEVVVFFRREFDCAVSVELLHDSSVKFVEFGSAAVCELLEVLSYVFYSYFALLIALHESAEFLYDFARDVFSLLDEYRLEHGFEVLQCLVTCVFGHRVFLVRAT
jgi:hypothetical protein